MNTSNKQTCQQISRQLRWLNAVWFILILLSLLGAIIADFSQLDKYLVGLVLVFVVIKAQLIIDIFMELKQVKLSWRLTMSGFAIVISLLVGLLY